VSVRGLFKFLAAFLLLFAFCACGKKGSDKSEVSPATMGCASNLRVIDGAKKQWAERTGASLTDTPTMDDLQPYFRHGPGKCRDGGTYTIGKVSELPQCSIPAHNDYFKAHQTPEPPPGP
jgi:hypothetical protein